MAVIDETLVNCLLSLIMTPITFMQGFGFAEVEQLYGLEIVRNAAVQLKNLYGGKGKMRLKLFISVNGLKLFDYYSFVSIRA